MFISLLSMLLVVLRLVVACYDLKLKLRLYLGKDLREVKGLIEVVKCKDTEEYLCYIY